PTSWGYNGGKSIPTVDKMVNRPRDFRHHDVVRAIRAATAAGIPNPSVRIRGPSGIEYYISGGEVTAPETKKSKQPRGADSAKGGGSSAMLGGGDRTVSAPDDAAGKQQSGSTGHRTSGVKKFAEGGKVRATGGEARRALPGACGTGRET